VDGVKAALVAELRRATDEVAAVLNGLDESVLVEGRYENGWNGREILAHLAAIEWTYPRLIELAKSARPEAGESGRADGSARDGMDGYNARQVAKRATASLPELVVEWTRNREALIAAVEAADESLLSAPVRSAGGRTGTLAQVLREVTVGHVAGHVRDMTGTA
jgi:hypothetical protein